MINDVSPTMSGCFVTKAHAIIADANELRRRARSEAFGAYGVAGAGYELARSALLPWAQRLTARRTKPANAFRSRTATDAWSRSATDAMQRRGLDHSNERCPTSAQSNRRTDEILRKHLP
jgi:hypothetical protein